MGLWHSVGPTPEEKGGRREEEQEVREGGREGGREGERGGRRRILELSYLYDGCVVVSRGSGHLCGYVRVPGNGATSHVRGGVSHLDDGFVLPQIPDN